MQNFLVSSIHLSSHAMSTNLCKYEWVSDRIKKVMRCLIEVGRYDHSYEGDVIKGFGFVIYNLDEKQNPVKQVAVMFY